MPSEGPFKWIMGCAGPVAESLRRVLAGCCMATTTTRQEWRSVMTTKASCLTARQGHGDLERAGRGGATGGPDPAWGDGGLDLRRRGRAPQRLAGAVGRRMEAAANGTEPPASPWPDELSDETDEGTDKINDWIYEQYHDRPIDEILAEAQEQWRRIRAAAEAIPEENLLTTGQLPLVERLPAGRRAQGRAPPRGARGGHPELAGFCERRVGGKTGRNDGIE